MGGRDKGQHSSRAPPPTPPPDISPPVLRLPREAKASACQVINLLQGVQAPAVLLRGPLEGRPRLLPRPASVQPPPPLPRALGPGTQPLWASVGAPGMGLLENTWWAEQVPDNIRPGSSDLFPGSVPQGLSQVL